MWFRSRPDVIRFLLLATAAICTATTASAAAAPWSVQAMQPTDLATLPLPPDLRAGAAVLEWNGAGTLAEVRPGDNGLFCIRDEDDGTRLWLECHPMALKPWIERRRATAGVERPRRNELLAAELRSGELLVPLGALSHNVSGRLEPGATAPTGVQAWREIAMPFATGESTGMSTSNAGAVPWLHHPGEPTAHVMIRYRATTWDAVVDGR